MKPPVTEKDYDNDHVKLIEKLRNNDALRTTCICEEFDLLLIIFSLFMLFELLGIY